jgi:hypothetical protein
MTPEQLAEFVDLHSWAAKCVKRGGAATADSSELGGRYDMALYRRLCQASVSLALERLHISTSAKREGNLSADFENWRSQSGSCTPYFVSRIVSDRAVEFIPSDRIWIAAYLVRLTPKIADLLVVIRKVVLEKKKKLFVMARFPGSEYLAETVIRLLSFDIASIRAGMSNKYRDDIAARFNDESSPLQVLFGTYATVSVGLNLNRACHHLVLFEHGVNANQELQAIGRVHRLNQQHEQYIYRLITRNTFERLVEYNATKKFRSQLVGMSPATFPTASRKLVNLSTIWQ